MSEELAYSIYLGSDKNKTVKAKLGTMNSIKVQAEEVVYNELIYV